MERCDASPPEFEIAHIPGVGHMIITAPSAPPADGALGFGKNCLHVDASATNAVDALWINAGDKNAANFDKLLRRTSTYSIPLNTIRIHDDFDSFLPEVAATDDLGFFEGTFLTASPTLKGVDVGGTGGTGGRQYGRFQIPVPPNYVAGTDITVAFMACVENVADQSATIDVEAVLCPSGIFDDGFDICITPARDINETSIGLRSFTLSGTDLGSNFQDAFPVLDIRFSTFVDDDGNAENDIRSKISSVAVVFQTT
jgi:hypothetical protein